jgi:hypothetical protein
MVATTCQTIHIPISHLHLTQLQILEDPLPPLPKGYSSPTNSDKWLHRNQSLSQEFLEEVTRWRYCLLRREIERSTEIKKGTLRKSLTLPGDELQLHLQKTLLHKLHCSQPHLKWEKWILLLSTTAQSVSELIWRNDIFCNDWGIWYNIFEEHLKI